MDHTYSIRSARLSDLSALPDIERAAGALFTSAGIGGEISVLSRAALEAACADDRLLVSTDRTDQPVGFAVLSTARKSAHLDEMDVHPDHGRRGIGTALLLAALDWARRRQLPMITLTTFRDPRWNAPFYAKHGFLVVPPGSWTPEQQARAAAEGVTEGSGRVLMRLDLRPAIDQDEIPIK